MDFTRLSQLYEACESFEQNKISLEIFQSSIDTHGLGLKGLNDDWYKFLNDLKGECALILYTERLHDHHTLGLRVSEKIKKYLMKNINNMQRI